MENKSIREIISVIFKAVTLAMGVAVVVLSCMGSLEPQTAITLLGICTAVFCHSSEGHCRTSEFGWNSACPV